VSWQVRYPHDAVPRWEPIGTAEVGAIARAAFGRVSAEVMAVGHFRTEGAEFRKMESPLSDPRITGVGQS